MVVICRPVTVVLFSIVIRVEMKITADRLSVSLIGIIILFKTDLV